MTVSDRRIRELQQMLRMAHGAVVKSIDGITEPEIRQVPAPDEWIVAQLLAHIAELEEKAVNVQWQDIPTEYLHCSVEELDPS